MSHLSFRPRVPVFDANVRVGDRRNEVTPVRTREALLAEMDRQGVGRALIYHAQAEDVSAYDGNLCLEPWLGKDERLRPQWVVLPTAESLGQLEDLYGQGRVSSVRLFETWTAGLPFRPWAYADLLSWLSERGIPVWIPLPEANVDDLVTTLQAYPDLVTVLVGAHYSQHLWIRPLLKALPNAHFELSRYEPIGQIEALNEEFGAERLLYGSWHSRYGMGPMLYYLHHTTLSDGELALVCGGNVERILQGGQSDD